MYQVGTEEKKNGLSLLFPKKGEGNIQKEKKLRKADLITVH